MVSFTEICVATSLAVTLFVVGAGTVMDTLTYLACVLFLRMKKSVGYKKTENWFMQYLPLDEMEEAKKYFQPEQTVPFDNLLFMVTKMSAWYQVLPLMIIASISSVWILKSLPYRQISYRMRGIVGEAMMEGSTFVPSDIPKFQIPLYRADLFSSTFIGYGLRYGDFLVLPLHVYSLALGKLVAKNTVAVGSFVASRLLADLCYIRLNADQWASIGAARITSYVREVKSNSVSCCGKSGFSTGYVRKMGELGMISYSGSTLPGYSGAAYYIGSQVVGMHLGLTGEVNCGVAMPIIAAEIAQVVCGEASISSYSEEEVLGKHAPKRHAFDVDYYSKLATQKWAKDVDDAYYDLDDQLDFGESAEDQELAEILDSLDQVQIQRIYARLSKMVKKKKTMVGQGSEEKEIPMPKSEIWTAIENLGARISSMDRDVEKLSTDVATLQSFANHVHSVENKVIELEQLYNDKSEKAPATPTIAEIPCEKCDKKFTTQLGVIMHTYAKHSKKIGESAIKSDFEDKISGKNPAFLGKSLLKKKSTLSKPATNGSAENEVFSSLLQNQLKMSSLMEKLLGHFENSHKDSNGQSSAVEPN
uniref:C2H2-type domain-containing protein n=1 Tax=Riboviria sp. TaxID=2585031 RepID=A0A8K1U4K7_9VIRU|nr:MAG: hypothetical protein 1 [Riboviria sp.]